ncbi:hypothetical protein QQ045_023815 [Rhodiola kirilowii]
MSALNPTKHETLWCLSNLTKVKLRTVDEDPDNELYKRSLEVAANTPETPPRDPQACHSQQMVEQAVGGGGGGPSSSTTASKTSKKKQIGNSDFK